MPEKRKPRVIKRYANRKLYDMSESCYITHDEIAALVEKGEEVRIVDNRTKEDLTRKTLTQILFEKEKKDRKTLPLATLRGLFESGGTFFQKHIAQPVTHLRDEAEETVRKVLRPLSTDANPEPETVEEPVLEDTDSAPRDGKQNPVDAFREWLEQSQTAVDNLQRTFEERWNLVLKSLGHFDKNHTRVIELEERVTALERELAELRAEKTE